MRAASRSGSWAGVSGTAGSGARASGSRGAGFGGGVHLFRVVVVEDRAQRVLRSHRHSLVVRPHEDGLPGAVAGAELAADAALEVHLDELHEVRMLGAGDDLDAVHRTEGDAGLATRAAGLIDDRELARRLEPRRLVDLDLLAVRQGLGHARAV